MTLAPFYFTSCSPWKSISRNTPGESYSGIRALADLSICVNKYQHVYNHPSKIFARENIKEVAARKGIHGAASAYSGGVLWEHGGDVSTMKLPCSSIELFSSNSRISVSLDSLAQEFSISRGSSWKIMVVS